MTDSGHVRPLTAVLIAGPTASGKSSAALALAKRIGGALINADSMQVYREPRILTARPDAVAEAMVPHFLYGHVSASEAYSVARYQSDALGALNEARAMRRIPIFVGGTGLYFSALTRGLAVMPPVPDLVRRSLRAEREEIGAEAFFAKFAARDPESAARLYPSDTQRVLRAAEVFAATGRPLSEWQQNRGMIPLDGYALVRLVLARSRPELYRCIDARFDVMVEDRALDEAAQLKGLDPALPAAKLLGLRELWSVLDGQMTLEAAKSAAKMATRRYAKRQLTWFRQRMAEWAWIETENPDEILGFMLDHIQPAI